MNEIKKNKKDTKKNKRTKVTKKTLNTNNKDNGIDQTSEINGKIIIENEIIIKNGCGCKLSKRFCGKHFDF